MYDPEFDFLAPGVFGAIREIEYTNKIRKDFDEQMKYYYMGFYIPDCQKSVYKGRWRPYVYLQANTHLLNCSVKSRTLGFLSKRSKRRLTLNPIEDTQTLRFRLLMT